MTLLQRTTSAARALINSSIFGRPLTHSTETQDIAEARQDDLLRYLWIKCSAHDTRVLDSYERFLTMAANHLNVDYVRTESPFRVIRRRTLLASRHVHKKNRTQYETRSYFRNLLFKNLTGSTADTYLEYVERNLPDGVMMIVERHRLSELPFDLVEESKDKEN